MRDSTPDCGARWCSPQLFYTLLNYALHQKYIFPQHSTPEQVPVLQKSISRHSNIVAIVVLVQVNVDNSITEGEEKRKIVAKLGLRSESENTPLQY